MSALPVRVARCSPSGYCAQACGCARNVDGDEALAIDATVLDRGHGCPLFIDRRFREFSAPRAVVRMPAEWEQPRAAAQRAHATWLSGLEVAA